MHHVHDGPLSQRAGQAVYDQHHGSPPVVGAGQKEDFRGNRFAGRTPGELREIVLAAARPPGDDLRPITKCRAVSA